MIPNRTVIALMFMSIGAPAMAASPGPPPAESPAAKKAPVKPLPASKRYFVRVMDAGKRGGAAPVRYAFRVGDSYKLKISNKGKVTDAFGGLYPVIKATVAIRHTQVRADGTVFYDGTLEKIAAKPRGKRRNNQVTRTIDRGRAELKQLVGTKFTGVVTATGRHIVSWKPPAALKKGRGVMWVWGILDVMREATLAFPLEPVGKKAKYQVHLPLPFKDNVALDEVTLGKVSKGKAPFTTKLGGGTIYAAPNSHVKATKLSGSAKGKANLMTIVPNIKRKLHRQIRQNRIRGVKNDVKESVIKVGKIKASKR